MNRVDVIQKIIKKTRSRTYLEIGVFKGNTFLKIKAKKKIAVDPNVKISKRKIIKWIFRNFCNISAKYYGITSDDFFANKMFIHGFDVVFIDGLHTFKQALIDVNNSLATLNEKGVIVMHDCNPPNWAAAYPAESHAHAKSLNLPGWTNAWCGDVWKTVCYIRNFRKDLNVFVLNCDYGLGIITKGKPEDNLNLTEDEFNNLTYYDLVKNKIELLNLKHKEYLYKFLNSF